MMDTVKIPKCAFKRFLYRCTGLKGIGCIEQR